VKIKEQINIFIVDDNKIFALALKTAIEVAFQNMPIKIHLFETGENCLERFMQVMPELVILDYYLNSNSPSAADGLEVLDKIKKYNLETSVIMLTSNDHIDTALKSFHHGASDYVVKTDSQFKKINDSISKIFANKELAFQNDRKVKQAVETIIANKELDFQNKEKEKWAEEFSMVNKELAFQNQEKEKRTAELITVNFQKAEVEKSKLIVEERNKDITDSINYAKRIQQAKLPKKEEIYSCLPQSFVLFKPKDIVSGDFYFLHKKNHFVYLAAADCTGHGVPGAFLSMICSEKLNQAVSLCDDTSEILKRLNTGIKTSLRQSESIESTKDGMDIALCSVDLENHTVRYAGANRPIWVIRKGLGVVEEIKATKKAIGGYTEDHQHFESHELKLRTGDTFYISTDGYADQFGGQQGKKLMTKKFKEILISIQNKSMPEQKIYLDDFIENWKVETEQVDDILVIGVRF